MNHFEMQRHLVVTVRLLGTKPTLDADPHVLVPNMHVHSSHLGGIICAWDFCARLH